MTEPFLGELRLFGFNFAPLGWAFCSGQLLPIDQNTALFSLLGTQYGGNGQTTFALPDLRGRVPISMGQGPGLSNYDIGEASGTETVTLNATQMPAHTHGVIANGGPASTGRPDNAVPARAPSNVYASAPSGTAMNAGMISSSGGNQPHNNLQPFLVLNWCIALQGIYPSRN
ncbi:MAG: tail fiber protein [Actinomycetota bacterium]|nr:tail fiber protein [Actinomycetota bacterium]